MVAHQVSKDAAKGGRLAKCFERLIWIRCAQSPQDGLAAFHAICRAQISNRIAGDQFLLHEEVEEAVDDAGSVQQR